MEAIFQWLFQQQSLGWVLFFASVIGVATLVVFGKLSTAAQISRDYETWRSLAGVVERLADSLDRNTDAVLGVQNAARDSEAVQRTSVHLLEEIQKRGSSRDNE